MKTYRNTVLILIAGLIIAGVARVNASGSDTIGAGGHSSPESYPGMQLAWRDEFNGKELDPRYWSHETGTGGWGNDGLQYYREENTQVRDGYLVITARQELFEESLYTSSRIVTRGKRELRYGRIDIRALLPEGQGISPVLRMLGSTTPRSGRPVAGEIDIMEMIGGQGRENTVHGTLRWTQDGGHKYEGGSVSLPRGKFSDQFHVFSILWDESSIRWLVDGYSYLEFDTVPPEFNAFREDFYLLFNLAIGGRRPGAPDASTTFPQRLVVDYVRVFH